MNFLLHNSSGYIARPNECLRYFTLWHQQHLLHKGKNLFTTRKTKPKVNKLGMCEFLFAATPDQIRSNSCKIWMSCKTTRIIILPSWGGNEEDPWSCLGLRLTVQSRNLKINEDKISKTTYYVFFSHFFNSTNCL